MEAVTGDGRSSVASWGARVLGLILDSRRPVAVVASRMQGANHIAAALVGHVKNCVWVRFLPEDVNDRISQGNRVAASLELAYGVSIVGTGLPVEYTLLSAAKLQRALGPTWFVLSDVEYALEACREVSTLHRAGANVVIIGTDVSHLESAQPNTLLGAQHVRVTPDDLEALRTRMHGSVPLPTLVRTAEALDWQYLALLVQVHRDLGLPPVMVPEPGGVSLAESGIEHVDRAKLVQALVARGRPGDALEAAIHGRVSIDDDLLNRGAQCLADEGLYGRLFGLVDGAGRALRMSSPAAMQWYFVAATATNRLSQVRSEVAEYLQAQPHPELAALFASAYPGPDLAEVTASAAAQHDTPLTLRLHAFAVAQSAPGPEAAELLVRAMRRADALGDRSQVMACATDLADFWLKRGRYSEALEWSRWALSYHEQHGLRDGIRALVALSLGAYIRILTGDLIGLEETVDKLDTSLSGVPTVETLVSTRADWLFLNGDFGGAADLYRVNVMSASFGQYATAAVDLVHALVHAGHTSEADAVAQRAVAVSRGYGEVAVGIAALARGLVLLARGSEGAAGTLQAAQDALGGGVEAHKLAQASIALARSLMADGNLQAAATALRRGALGLDELAPSGWRLLGGFYPDIDVLRRLYRGESDSLEMSFLGEARVSIGEQLVDLGLRHKEVLAVLALHSNGLSAEQLGVKVYGDSYNFSSLKAAVSKLRKVVKVASRPYSIAHRFRADFLDVQEFIAEGRVREALSLYRGDLLPGSNAPEVLEWRTYLEELVRAAVLREGDVDLLLRLASVIPGDLELVEAALAVLAPHDPRRARARALLARVQSAWAE